MSDELDEGLRWIVFDPRVISRDPSSLPECLMLKLTQLETVSLNFGMKLSVY